MLRTPRGRDSALAGIGIVAFALASCSVAAAAAHTPEAECANSSASVRPLATIENAAEHSFQCLGLSMDGETITAIRLETHSFASSNERTTAQSISVTEFPPTVLESTRGAVLDGVPDHDAIVLRGHLFPLTGKQPLVVSYLYNGFTGEYRSCLMTLDRGPGGGWRLVDRLAQPISRIVVNTREMPIIGAFGIASLAGACL